MTMKHEILDYGKQWMKTNIFVIHFMSRLWILITLVTINCTMRRCFCLVIKYGHVFLFCHRFYHTSFSLWHITMIEKFRYDSKICRKISFKLWLDIFWNLQKWKPALYTRISELFINIFHKTQPFNRIWYFDLVERM